MNIRAQLVPADGAPLIEIQRDLTLVGRKEDCDVRLDHKSVSKVHCVIVKSDGLLLVRDLGSTNGTRVNGQRVRRAALLPNDKLSIAQFHFKIHFGPPGPEEAARPDEHTQAIDSEIVAQLPPLELPPAESAVEEPRVVPVQANPLPDVYPEEEK